MPLEKKLALAGVFLIIVGFVLTAFSQIFLSLNIIEIERQVNKIHIEQLTKCDANL